MCVRSKKSIFLDLQMEKTPLDSNRELLNISRQENPGSRRKIFDMTNSFREKYNMTHNIQTKDADIENLNSELKVANCEIEKLKD